ncbi:MAG: glucose 1-dehydrogenase [Prolixibacteraceae bacterium]|nr:glucose 1-dehydrogenase [Prolixibacteraceae bacterium]
MKKKVAIVTGAGQGIGQAIAMAFAMKKYHVLVADINPITGNSVVDTICDKGESALFIKTDVSKVEELEAMIHKTYNQFGRIDVLVNNAGISAFGDPFLLDEATWDKIIDTNLKGVFFASRTVAHYMKSTGGAIVNIASTRALMSEPNSEAYAASKGGILALTHALAASFAPYKIMVNAIAPGWIETGDYSSLKASDHEQHFASRVGKPDDIARACLFLSDRENNFITGTQLVIDGGMTRKMQYED